MRRCAATLLILLAGGLARLAAQAEPPPAPPRLAVAGARLGPVPDVLYAHLPALATGQGLLVEEVEPGSPLGRAGLRRHDILLTCDGARLRDGSHLAELLAGTTPGRSHRLGLLRAGQGMSLDVPRTTAPAVVPKSVLKPGGPPAVAVDAQPLEGGKLRVSFLYYTDAGKLERVTCSGSLRQIEDEVRQLGERQRMPRRVQDLADVALKRIRSLNTSEQR